MFECDLCRKNNRAWCICDECKDDLDRKLKEHACRHSCFRHEDEIKEKDQKISGLNHALSIKEAECMRAEKEIADLKAEIERLKKKQVVRRSIPMPGWLE